MTDLVRRNRIWQQHVMKEIKTRFRPHRAAQPNSGDILAHEFLEANSWADGPAEDGACTLSKSPPVHAMNGAYSDGLRSDGKKPGRLYTHYPKARSVIGVCEDGLTEFGELSGYNQQVTYDKFGTIRRDVVKIGNGIDRVLAGTKHWQSTYNAFCEAGIGIEEDKGLIYADNTSTQAGQVQSDVEDTVFPHKKHPRARGMMAHTIRDPYHSLGYRLSTLRTEGVIPRSVSVCDNKSTRSTDKRTNSITRPHKDSPHPSQSSDVMMMTKSTHSEIRALVDLRGQGRGTMQVGPGQGLQIAKPPSYWPVYDVQALPNLMKKHQPDVSSTSKSHDVVTGSLSPRISSSRIRRK